MGKKIRNRKRKAAAMQNNVNISQLPEKVGVLSSFKKFDETTVTEVENVDLDKEMDAGELNQMPAVKIQNASNPIEVRLLTNNRASKPRYEEKVEVKPIAVPMPVEVSKIVTTTTMVQPPQPNPESQLLTLQAPRDTCNYCRQEGHQTATCKEYGRLPVQVRRVYARARHWCFSCLAPHSQKGCRYVVSCIFCRAAHHPLLCGSRPDRQTGMTQPATTAAPSGSQPQRAASRGGGHQGPRSPPSSSAWNHPVTGGENRATRHRSSPEPGPSGSPVNGGIRIAGSRAAHLKDGGHANQDSSGQEILVMDAPLPALERRPPKYEMDAGEPNQMPAVKIQNASKPIEVRLLTNNRAPKLRYEKKVEVNPTAVPMPVEVQKIVTRTTMVQPPQPNADYISTQIHYTGHPYPSGIPRSFLLSSQIIAVPGVQPPHQQNPNQPLVWTTNPEEIESGNPEIPHELYNISETPLTTESYTAISTPCQDENEGATTSQNPNQEDFKTGVSAFKRLGPVSQPKKPKLTINLSIQKDHFSREVIESTEQCSHYVPVHLRPNIINSKDDIVSKYLPLWPWKRDITRKTVSARTSKSAMMMEQEIMEEKYSNDKHYIQVTVTGYPPSWTKEDVFDAMFEKLKGKSFIPCFIEHTSAECKFLVIKSRLSLVQIHKMGFVIKCDDIELSISISTTLPILEELCLYPKNLIAKRLRQNLDSESRLSLKEFFLAEDISHFVYFPLSRVTNQFELLRLTNSILWENIVDLDLSYNNISNLEGFSFVHCMPKLKYLNLSYNRIDSISTLLACKELPLKSIKLEGNPLCLDYIDAEHYVKAIRMLFPMISEIDSIRVHFSGDLPESKKYYCPADVQPLINRFLEMYYALIESKSHVRESVIGMYRQSAVLTVTNTANFRYDQKYKNVRKMFSFSRSLEDRDLTCIDGAAAITQYISNWPSIRHDPFSFTIDVLAHNDSSTVFRVGGIAKLTSKVLAEDELLLAFTRTIVLNTRDGVHYKICNELLYWDEPHKEFMFSAFQVTTTNPKQLSTKLDFTPDDDLKENLINIFKKLTNLNKEQCERCLSQKDWDIKSALEYFIKLLKLDNLSVLYK